MRILMAAACPLPWARGTPIRIHRMAEALCRRGHDVQVVTYPLGDQSNTGPYGVHRVAAGFRRLDPRPGPSFTRLLYLDPLVCAKLKALLESGGFDVLHAHHYEGLMASLIARRLSVRIPVIYDAHTLLESELPYYGILPLRSWTARAGRFLDRRVPPRADRVIAVSPRIRDRLVGEERVSPERISVISNGVELEHFGSSAAPATNGSRPRIVFAGNLAEYQGIDLLLAAFARVLDAVPDARLQVLTSSATGEVAACPGASGVVHAVRFADPDYAALPASLAAADVLVNPRINCDGVPQKLLNYMAAGRPIVSFASSAPVLEHEVDALVVPDGDTRAFGDAVVRLLRDPALGRALGAAARNKVAAGHSWDCVAAKVEAVYASALEGAE